MDTIKVEVEDLIEENYLGYRGSCFICLQQVLEINEEQFNSLNFFFNYLKINGIKEAFVCGKCGESLTKFVELCRVLEKVRLEMDYLLDFIRGEILATNQLKSGNSVREMVVKKCSEQMGSRPQIVLERLDISRIKKESSPIPVLNRRGRKKRKIALQKRERRTKRSKKQRQPPTSDCLDDWLHWDEDESRTPATPVNHEDIKFEGKTVKTSKAKNSNQSNRKSKCRKCSELFDNKHILALHWNAVHRIIRHQCDLCGKTFVSPIKLRLHQLKPHEPIPSIPNPFPCKLCEKTFPTAQTLKWHERSHLPKEFFCDICHKTFRGSFGLKRHVASVHKKERQYCQVEGCNKNYSSPSDLNDHYRLDHPDFKPPPKPKILKYSEKVEDGEIVMECKYCQNTFKSVKLVVDHISKVHQREKLVCADCGYTTRRKSSLKIHIERIHKTDESFECNICNKQCNSVQILKLHLRIAHGPRKFKCHYCHFSATLNNRLQKHLRTVHKDKHQVGFEES